MAIGSAIDRRFGEAWSALNAHVDAEGTARESFATRLTDRTAATRDLADAVHGLCMLHGRHPGVIDFAQGRADNEAIEAWFEEAVRAFAAERATLVRLVADVGPLPSTPGQAESEAAIGSQRHALDMLASSDRPGCAIGAAMALALDWAAVRQVLDAAAHRVGLSIEPSHLPVEAESATVFAELAHTPAFERAMLFGAQQMLAQHRALWQLLEARAQARSAHD